MTWPKESQMKLEPQVASGSESTVAAAETNHSITPSPQRAERKEKTVVKGKRKIWGTHKVTTARAVQNTINSIANIGSIEVKRKYHLSGVSQLNLTK